jgi:hypothetical protein
MKTLLGASHEQSENPFSQLKKAWILTAVAVTATLMAALAGCNSVTPDAGHEVVLVEKPMLFGRGGVDPQPVRAGRTFVAATTQGIDVNMQPVAYQQDLPDTMTATGFRSAFTPS